MSVSQSFNTLDWQPARSADAVCRASHCCASPQGYDPKAANTQVRFWYKRAVRPRAPSRGSLVELQGQEEGQGQGQGQGQVGARRGPGTAPPPLRLGWRDDGGKWVKVEPAQCMDGLGALGLQHNDNLLVEVKEGAGEWVGRLAGGGLSFSGGRPSR